MNNTQRWIVVLIAWCVWFAVVMSLQCHHRQQQQHDQAEFAQTIFLITNHPAR